MKFEKKEKLGLCERPRRVKRYNRERIKTEEATVEFHNQKAKETQARGEERHHVEMKMPKRVREGSFSY